MPYFNIPSKVLRKKNPPKGEYENSALIPVFVGSSVKIECFRNECSGDEVAGAVPSTPSPHLRDSYSIAIAPVFGHYSKQAN